MYNVYVDESDRTPRHGDVLCEILRCSDIFFFLLRFDCFNVTCVIILSRVEVFFLTHLPKLCQRVYRNKSHVDIVPLRSKTIIKILFITRK